MQTSDNKSIRKVYLDILRVCAIILVIFNHTAEFHIPFNRDASLYTYAFLHFSILDKIAVPLFFMITGALLLPKEESFSVIFKKRVLRICIVIFIFQLIQHAYSSIALGFHFTISTFLLDCIEGNGSSAMTTWFLYAYLSVLLMLPILRILAKNMSTKHFVYLFALHLLFSSFSPIHNGIERWLILSNNYNQQYVFIYLFAGYYIENRLRDDFVTKKRFVFLAASSILSVFVGAAMCEFGRHIMHHSHYVQDVPCFQGCVFMLALTTFLAAKHFIPICFKSKRVNALLQMLGGAVFTVMLTENIFRITASRLCYHCTSSHLASFVMTLCFVMVAGFALGIILKQLPVVKKII